VIAKTKSDIWTPYSEIENLGEAFRAETKAMLEKVALKHGCNVEELKFTVNNIGIVNIQRMTADEIIDRESQRQIDKQIKKIKESRGS